jgi:hypothetical protein
MNIHQLSLNYISEQDRILVRINTTAGEELRLWFTRRLTLGLWPMLNRIVAEHVAKQAAVDPASIVPTANADDQTKKMLAEFKKEETLQKADFKTPYKDAPAALPLGADPLLVTEVNIAPLPSGQLQLNFSEKLPGVTNPRGFQMALESQLIHGFVHLLDKSIALSQWTQAGGGAAQPEAAKAADEAAASDKPKYLN